MTVASCVGHKQAQRFDVTPLVASISSLRNAGLNRCVKDDILIDGSKLANGKLAELKFKFFCDTSPKPDYENMIKLMANAVGMPVPLSFFAARGKRSDDG